MAAIALGQIIGLSPVTSAAVRWQMLPTLGAKTTMQISVNVGLSFLLCWAVLAVVASTSLGLLPVMSLVLLCIVVFCALLLLPRHTRMSRTSVFRLLGLTTLDVGFAGLALWMLLPSATTAELGLVLAAFTLALGAGLISNAPGGIGAFDLTLLTVLSTFPETEVFAALLAFRIIYYVLPAVWALSALFRSLIIAPAKHHHTTAQPLSDLVHQGAKTERFGQDVWVLRHHMLGNVALEPDGDADALSQFTQDAVGFRALYKSGARLSVTARKVGWAVRRIADEALISPQTWTVDGPEKRQLRRKLRHAVAAGVRIESEATGSPFEAMDGVAADWMKSHGAELGYAMGRYTHELIAAQSCYLIWQGPTLVGFVTVQRRKRIWAVDIIRHNSALPCGGMQACLQKIIADARDQSVGLLSLGCVPSEAPFSRIQAKFRCHKSGLVQFKQSFDPRWIPRYHAAPTRLQWIMSMTHVVWHVQRPFTQAKQWVAGTCTSLIMISPFFHLNDARAREMAAATHTAPL